MPILISTQPSILSWDVQKAKLDQNGNGVQTLDLQSVAPVLEIETQQPKILIDQSQSFSEAGLKGLKSFMNEASSYGLQIVSQGIARIVDQGNAYIEIQSGYNPFPDQAINNAYDMFDKEFNYGAIPQSRPTITLNRGQVAFNFRQGEIKNQSRDRKVEMNYTPWQINYYVKQYNDINFRYEPSQFKFTV
jgi:hypothetical protein